MPLPQEKRDLKHMTHFLVMGLVVLGIVFLTPYNGLFHERSFFSVVASSHWLNFGDWVAAWCSIKIMLLSVAVVFLVLSVEEMLLYRQSIRLANIAILALLVPVLGFGMGIYYLIKSLL
jgi:hypothetical protein